MDEQLCAYNIYRALKYRKGKYFWLQTGPVLREVPMVVVCMEGLDVMPGKGAVLTCVRIKDSVLEPK